MTDENFAIAISEPINSEEDTPLLSHRYLIYTEFKFCILYVKHTADYLFVE